MSSVGHIHDRQKQYWAELGKLKFACLYIRYYRNRLGKQVTGIAIFRAIASSGSIAGWAIWHQFFVVWAVIIALSQVADAVKDLFPLAKQHKAASELAITLNTLFTDAQLEWDSISSGKYTDDQISERLYRIRMQPQNAEQQSFPDGLAENLALKERANQDTNAYFSSTYGIKV